MSIRDQERQPGMSLEQMKEQIRKDEQSEKLLKSVEALVEKVEKLSGCLGIFSLRLMRLWRTIKCLWEGFLTPI